MLGSMYAVLCAHSIRYDAVRLQTHIGKKAAKNCDHCEMYTHKRRYNEAQKKFVWVCVRFCERVGKKATRTKWWCAKKQKINKISPSEKHFSTNTLSFSTAQNTVKRFFWLRVQYDADYKIRQPWCTDCCCCCCLKRGKYARHLNACASSFFRCSSFVCLSLSRSLSFCSQKFLCLPSKMLQAKNNTPIDIKMH